MIETEDIMTDEEKLKIYEKNLDIQSMIKINKALESGKDLEIQHRRDSLVILTKKTETFARIERR